MITTGDHSGAADHQVFDVVGIEIRGHDRGFPTGACPAGPDLMKHIEGLRKRIIHFDGSRVELVHDVASDRPGFVNLIEDRWIIARV